LALARRDAPARLLTVAACVGASAVLAGCGSASSSSSPPTTTRPVSVERTVTALQSSDLKVCQTTHGGEAPGIKVQAVSQLELDCGGPSRSIGVYSFDDANIAFAVAGGGVASGDDTWLLGNLTVAGVALTDKEASAFDQTMRSLGAHRYQSA
jgi:hypothetical protein